jgi:hypothetical protein
VSTCTAFSKVIKPVRVCTNVYAVIRNKHPDNVGNRMHLDLQKSAFGASFSAKRLLPCTCSSVAVPCSFAFNLLTHAVRRIDQLKRELHENANVATGADLDL